MLSLTKPSANANHDDLFIERYEKLLSWAIKFTDNNRELAEDLVQDAFVQFTFSRPDLSSIHNLDGYLYGMLRHLHLSQVRRATRSRLQPLTIIEYESAEMGLRAIDPRTQIQVQDELRRVCHYACVRKETAKVASVLILRFFHGYYPSEIMRLLRSSRSAVRERLRIARAEARLSLENPQALGFMGDNAKVEFLSTRFARTTFAGATGAVSGKVASGVILAFAGPKYLSINNFSMYAQDTWRANRRLTLNYGVRWDVDGYPSERNGNFPTAVSGLDNPATMTLAPQGARLWKTRYNNFAPRLGVAYQLSDARGRETIIRGGFGVFYDLPYGSILNAFSSSWPSQVTKVLPAGTPFPYDAVAATPPILSRTPPAGAIVVTDPNLKLPYTYEWNMAVERSLGGSQTLSASYVGAAGRRLLRQEQLTNPNPTFTTVRVTRNTATSDYHAMQLQYNRRLSRGIQALASYTWAHSIDIASSDDSSLAPVAILNPKIDRASSDFDVRHTFNAAVTYNLPPPSTDRILGAVLSGWSIDAIFTARSATPVNITTTTDVLGLGITSVSRPDLVQGAPLYITDTSVAGGRRFNRAAFSIPPANSGRQGSLGRNVLRGFPLYQLDFSVRRRFSLTESVKLEFRSEFFNIFNHPNFADPQGSLGSNGVPNALFGQSTTMFGRSLGSGGLAGGFNPLYQVGGPRSIQLAVKLSF